jgi:hypothetical protein
VCGLHRLTGLFTIYNNRWQFTFRGTTATHNNSQSVALPPHTTVHSLWHYRHTQQFTACGATATHNSSQSVVPRSGTGDNCKTSGIFVSDIAFIVMASWREFKWFAASDRLLQIFRRFWGLLPSSTYPHPPPPLVYIPVSECNISVSYLWKTFPHGHKIFFNICFDLREIPWALGPGPLPSAAWKCDVISVLCSKCDNPVLFCRVGQ